MRSIFPDADANAEGSGAAGGLGFAFQAFLNGKLQSGSRLVMEMSALEKAIRGADLVLTGEGKLDGQTAFGKAPFPNAGGMCRTGGGCQGKECKGLGMSRTSLHALFP